MEKQKMKTINLKNFENKSATRLWNRTRIFCMMILVICFMNAFAGGGSTSSKSSKSSKSSDDHVILVPSGGSGNVGIGTNNPTDKLTVVGDARVTGVLKVGVNSVVISGLFPAPGNDIYSSQSTGDLFINSGMLGLPVPPDNIANTILNARDNTANVGIGLTSPGEKLHVSQFIRSNSLGAAYSTGSLANTDGLVVADQDGKLFTKIGFTGNANDVLLGDGTFGSGPADADWTAVVPPLSLTSNIYHTGKVGIGGPNTFGPLIQLSVLGGTRTEVLYFPRDAVVGSNVLNTVSSIDNFRSVNMTAQKNINLIVDEQSHHFVNEDVSAGVNVYRDGVSGNPYFTVRTTPPSAQSGFGFPAGFRGRVGINITEPEAAFHIGGSAFPVSLSQGGLLMAGPSNAKNIVMDRDEIQARDNGSASNLFLQKNGGHVGIGTSSPAASLDVNGTVHVRSPQGVFTNAVKSYTGAGLDLVGGAQTRVILVPGNIFKVVDQSNNPLWHIDNVGDVGIGTASPAEKLDVKGTIQMTGFKLPTGATNGHVLISDAAGVGTWQPSSAVADNDWTGAGTGQLYPSNLTDNVGIGTSTPEAQLHVEGDDGVLFRGTFGSGSIPVEGAGTRMMWYPGKAAFRAGRVHTDPFLVTAWDDVNVGTYSVAMGFSTVASGDRSVAMGDRTTASGEQSIALGAEGTEASGEASFAVGSGVVASGDFSIALGDDNEAGGDFSTALGAGTEASGDYTTAMGFASQADADYAIAMGRNTLASGISSTAMGEFTRATAFAATAMGSQTKANEAFSTAMGDGTEASGPSSTAMGEGTIASGESSTAAGSGTEANGDYSIAMGFGSMANGEISTAMGTDTEANGEAAVAMGNSSIADGDNAVAMGLSTTAQAYSSLTIGRYNEIAGAPSSWVAADPLFVIGNGTSAAVPSNAMTVLKNGDVGIGISTPDAKLHVEPDDGVLFTGTVGFGPGPIPTDGAGTRLMWYPHKAAFRTGHVSGTAWDDINIGRYSVAMGNDPIASGTWSISLGTATEASGNHSTAIGDNTIASAEAATALGVGAEANGEASTAMGIFTKANGDFSTAMGNGADADGEGSTAMGTSTTASGNFSTAMGNNTEASGLFTTASGLNSTAQAYASFVIGRYNEISGNQLAWVPTDPLFTIGNGISAALPSNAMTVLKNGNVGVGTSTPNDKLEVDAGVSGKSGLLLTQLKATTPTTATPGDFDPDKVLSVDNNGEVILIDISMPGNASSKTESQQALENKVAYLEQELTELRACMAEMMDCQQDHQPQGYNSLDQNYPNPFSGSTTINYHLERGGSAVMKVYNSMGVWVATLVDENQEAGDHSVIWDARDLNAGIYIYTLSVDSEELFKRAVHIK